MPCTLVILCASAAGQAEQTSLAASRISPKEVPPPHAELLESGRQALIKSDFSAAIAPLEEFVKRFPTDRRAGLARIRLASAYLRSKRLQEAERHYLAAADFYQSDPVRHANALAILAGFYSGQKRFEQAIETLERVARKYPETQTGLEAPFRVALLYEQQAQIAMVEARKGKPVEIASRTEAANLPGPARNSLEKAIKSYQKALKQYPQRLENALTRLQSPKPGTLVPRADCDDCPGKTPTEEFWTERKVTAFGDPDHAGYLANRARLGLTDRYQQIMLRMAGLYEKLGKSRKAGSVREALYKHDPDSQGSARLRLQRAEELLRKSRFDKALAEGWSGLRWPRVTPAILKARSPVNQAYLNERRRSQPAEELRQALDILLRSSGSKASLSSEQLESVALAWKMAWGHTLEGDFQEARAAYRQLASLYPSTILEILGDFGEARIFALQSLYGKAVERFAAITEKTSPRWPVVAGQARFEAALAFCRWGRFDRAAEVLLSLAEKERDRADPSRRSYRQAARPAASALKPADRIPESPTMSSIHPALSPGILRVLKEGGIAADRDIRARATYRLGQCHEFRGDFQSATESYEKAARTSADPELVQLAENSHQRLMRAPQARTSSPARVRYIGEDRTTGGDWHGSYGHQAYILCAQCVPRDVVGDRGRPAFYSPPTPLEFEKKLKSRPFTWKYAFRSGTEADTARRWLTRQDDPFPSSLFDPMIRARSMANIDDHSEQWPLGVPVDLAVELQIPRDLWRVSLYCVNDPNFWEPSRRYVVWAMDEDDRYLAGTEVEDFLNGVYKHFAVAGPLTLRFRIHRGRSLNTLLSGLFLAPLIRSAPDRSPGLVSKPDGEAAEVIESASEWVRTVSESQDVLPDLDEAEAVRRRLADLAIAATGLSAPNGKAGSLPVAKDPGIKIATENPHDSNARAAAAWWLWRFDQILGKGKAAETYALNALAAALRECLGFEKSDEVLKKLAQRCRQPSENLKAPVPGLAHAEWIEEIQIHKTTSHPDTRQTLDDVIRRYYPLDRSFCRRIISEHMRRMLEESTKGEFKAWALERAALELAKGRHDLSRVLYEKLSAVYRGLDADFYDGYARCLINLQDHLRAASLLEKQLRLVKEQRKRNAIFLSLVAAYAASGRSDVAQRTAGRYVSSPAPDGRVAANMYYLIGCSYNNRQHNPDAALLAFKRSINADPTSSFSKLSKNWIKRLQTSH